VSSERGSGSVLALALGLGLVALTAVLVPLYGAYAVRQSVAAAADAAALAGADVASGLVPGYPCATAARVARSNGASIVSCTVDGLVVTVVVGRQIIGIPVLAIATAGPAGSGVD
jgi:secretion/DNA translocation related TadE-like protein